MHKLKINIKAIKLLYSFCPSYFVIMILSAFFTSITPYFNIYMSAEVINTIASNRGTKNAMNCVVITVMGNFIIRIISSFLNRELEHKTVLFHQKERAAFNNKILQLDYEDLENTQIRQLKRKISESAKVNGYGKQKLINCLNNFVLDSINIFIAFVFFLELFVLIFSAKFSWSEVFLISFVIILIVMNVVANFHEKNKMAQITNKITHTMIEENRIENAIDCYNMGKDIRLYRQDRLIINIMKKTLKIHKNAFRDVFKKKFKEGIALQIFSYVLQLTTYVLIYFYAKQKILGIGSVIKYIGLTEKIIKSIINIFADYSDIKSNTPFIQEYLMFFDIPQKMNSGTKKFEVNTIDFSKCEVEFRNVSFKYPLTEHYVLRNFSFKFKLGESMAIVGMNGSGKTTFIKLLCRLYDPNEGEILVNGVDIKQYQYDEYIAAFSVVFQDFKLLSFTIGENIACASNYDEFKVKQCLEKLGCGERYIKSNNSLNRYIYREFDENGMELSGGEEQKLALARALYKDAPILVLDEPTASLDPLSEYEVYQMIDKMAEDKTIIFISHRLSSCRFCDKIIVLHNGKLIEQGNHNELLLNKNGKYYEMWNTQAQYYVG